VLNSSSMVPAIYVIVVGCWRFFTLTIVIVIIILRYLQERQTISSSRKSALFVWNAEKKLWQSSREPQNTVRFQSFNGWQSVQWFDRKDRSNRTSRPPALCENKYQFIIQLSA
jgi:hypothetical protein